MLQKITNRPDSETMGWRAIYDRGREFSSDQIAWADLPEHGVQIIIFYDRVRPYRAARIGEDHYWYFPETGMFDSCTDAEIEKDPERIPQEAKDRNLVKRGKEIPTRRFEAIMRRALGPHGPRRYWLSPGNEHERIDKWQRATT